jgi:hypothetical protein
MWWEPPADRVEGATEDCVVFGVGVGASEHTCGMQAWQCRAITCVEGA